MTASDKTSPGAGSGSETDSLKIRWDQAEIDTLHCTAFNIVSAAEHIGLLFGNRAGTEEGADITLKIRAQILLSPFIAKRFGVLLRSFIEKYELQFGSLTPEPGKPGTGVAGARRSTGEASDFLFELVKGISPASVFERSFKVNRGNILDNRFLLGVSRKEMGAGADALLAEACSSMEMPSNLVDIFSSRLPDADYVHFGFEENENTLIYKVYLEFLDSIQKDIRKRKKRPEKALLHLGLKWDIENPSRQAVTRYDWHPWIPEEEIVRRVADILESEPSADLALLSAVRELVSLSRGKIPDKDILYLEVTEDGNPRRSFDINLYRADLQVAEVYPVLSMLSRRHGISYDRFHSLYNNIRAGKFGHLAGGRDRSGNDYFTVYYGAEKATDKSKRSREQKKMAVASAGRGAKERKRQPAKIEEADEKARLLLGLVGALGVETGIERSFKFREKSLLSNRYLTGFRRPADGGLDKSILNICREIQMPRAFQTRFRAELPEAEIVLFGFEKDGKNRMLKAYLEFTGRMEDLSTQSPRLESVPIHTAFKWDISKKGQKIFAQYHLFPPLTPGRIAERILAEFFGRSKGDVFGIVDDVLDLAGSRTQPGDLLYFEATEEGNPRSSFDINAYRAKLLMSEIYPLLAKMARHYSVELKKFDELYEDAKTRSFGHLSGGIDREGKSFLTVYFSEKRSAQRLIL